MTDLVAFLTARLDEDEHVAKGLIGAARFLGREPDFYGAGGPAAEAHWRRFDPAQVLADIASKRALLDRLLTERHMTCDDGWYSCSQARDTDGETLCYDDSRAGKPCDCGRYDRVDACQRLLALPYTAHPDYREDWKP